MPSFTVFIEFNLNVYCVKTITFVNLHHISAPEFMDAFLYGIYKIQFKCKLCKDNNICYENFYHILFHSSWMPSFTELIEFNLNVNFGRQLHLL